MASDLKTKKKQQCFNNSKAAYSKGKVSTSCEFAILNVTDYNIHYLLFSLWWSDCVRIVMEIRIIL